MLHHPPTVVYVQTAHSGHGPRLARPEGQLVQQQEVEVILGYLDDTGTDLRSDSQLHPSLLHRQHHTLYLQLHPVYFYHCLPGSGHLDGHVQVVDQLVYSSETTDLPF